MTAELKLAAWQFAGGADVAANRRQCRRAAEAAAAAGAQLLLLPEGTLSMRAREEDSVYVEDFQGEFVRTLTALSQEFALCIVAGMFTPAADGRAHNTLVAVVEGALRTYYHKLHLYDAFASRESVRIAPGNARPPVFSWRGFNIGLMTCYDLRFPEVARALAEDGADIILLPAAWFAGEHKLQHWRLLTAARALENGVYLLAADMCGAGRIGHSLFADAWGQILAEAGTAEELLTATATHVHLQQVREILPQLAQRRFALKEKW